MRYQCCPLVSEKQHLIPLRQFLNLPYLETSQIARITALEGTKKGHLAFRRLSGQAQPNHPQQTQGLSQDRLYKFLLLIHSGLPQGTIFFSTNKFESLFLSCCCFTIFKLEWPHTFCVFVCVHRAQYLLNTCIFCKLSVWKFFHKIITFSSAFQGANSHKYNIIIFSPEHPICLTVWCLLFKLTNITYICAQKSH